MSIRGTAALAATLALAALAACAPATPAQPAAAPAKPAAQPTTSTASVAQPAPPKPAATAAAPVKSAAPDQPAAASKAAFDEKAVADFYRGKTIRIVVGFGAGGGYDAYSRLIAKHLGQYIPGNPTVIVENMPGAGSIVAANHVYNTAPQDGTVIGNVQGYLALTQALGADGVQFDMAKMQYVGIVTGDKYVLFADKRSGVTTFNEVMGPNSKQLVIGSVAPGNVTEDGPVLMRDLTGANLKVVSGYDGTAKIRLAIETGEVAGYVNAIESDPTAQQKVQSGEWNTVLQFAEEPRKGLENVPTALSFAQTDEQRQMIRLVTISAHEFVRAYMFGPQVPGDRVEALKVAFDKTMADKEFLAEAEKAKLSVDPVSPARADQLTDEILAMPEGIKAKVRSLVLPRG